MAAVSLRSLSPARLNLRSDACIGIAVAVALNVAMVGALLRWTAAPLREAVDAEAVLTVVWIPRAPPAQSRAVRDPKIQRAARVVRSTREKRPGPATTPAAVTTVTAPEGAAAPHPALRVIHEDPFAGMSFRKNILAHPQSDAFDAAQPPTFRVRDSSLGGRLQRMARGADCGELRRALRSASGSGLDAIVRTMEERGCS